MNKPPIAVVYKTIYRKKEKYHLKVFNEVYVDDIITTKKRKPLIPDNAEIIIIGVGSSFEMKFKEKYPITDTTVEESSSERAIKELENLVKQQRGH